MARKSNSRYSPWRVTRASRITRTGVFDWQPAARKDEKSCVPTRHSAAAAMPNQAKPVTVGVTPEGAVFIDETPVAESDLVAQLNALGVDGAQDRIFLRGDTSANYGAVMRVMGLLSAGGFSKIGLITQPDR